MPLCGCLPCCKPSDEYEFEEIDKFIIQHAKKTNRYKRKCRLFRPKVEFVVQWGHLNVTSKLEEFQLIPNELTLDAFQEGDLTGINNKRLSQQGENSRNSALPLNDGKPQCDNDTQEETDKEKDTPGESSTSPLLESINKHPNNDAQDGTDVHKEKTSRTGKEQEAKPPPSADPKDVDVIEKAPAQESEEAKSKLLEDSQSESSVTKSHSGLNFSAVAKLFSKFKRKKSSADKGKDDIEEMTEWRQKGKVTITEQDEGKGITDIKHAILKGAIADRTLSLFRTEYTNTSGQNQNFTFQTERRTKSSVSVNVQRSYKIGGKITLGLKLPAPSIVPVSKCIDPLNVTGELSGEMQWTKSKTDTMEREEVWSVNNTVNVKHNHTTTAELKVHEEEATATFKVRHRVTPIYSTSRKQKLDALPIYIVPKADLKKKPEKQKVLDVLKIFKDRFCESFENNCQSIEVNMKDNYIEFTTEGVVKCVYQARQVIDVHTKYLAQSVETQTAEEEN